MPLNEQEREWLERRKVLCNHCELIKRTLCGGGKNKTSCQLWEDYHCNNPVKRYKAFQDMQDAAEFEARVAVLLTDRDDTYIPPCHIVCNHRRKCRACRLMYARLAIEAEMDK